MHLLDGEDIGVVAVGMLHLPMAVVGVGMVGDGEILDFVVPVEMFELVFFAKKYC